MVLTKRDRKLAHHRQVHLDIEEHQESLPMVIQMDRTLLSPELRLLRCMVIIYPHSTEMAWKNIITIIPRLFRLCTSDNLLLAIYGPRPHL